MSGSVHDNLTAYTTALTQAMHKLDMIHEIAKAGLNADSGDAEREALADIAGIVGLEYNDEEGRYE